MQHKDALTRFHDSLPNKPYCSDDKQLKYTLDKEEAVGHPYIQVNYPLVRYIVFDLDHSDAALAATECGMPLPTITAVNRNSGHAHIMYELSSPIPREPSGATKSLMKDVVGAYKDILCADKCITTQRQLVKNPLHDEWDVDTTDRTYSLSELAGYIPNEWKTARNHRQLNHGVVVNIGIRSFTETLDPLSRHMSIFENARYFAYYIVHDCRDYNEFHDRIFEWVNYLNDVEIPKHFPTKLGHSELRSLAESIARWVYDRRNSFRQVNHGAMRLPSMRGRLLAPDEYRSELQHRQGLSAHRTNGIRRSRTRSKITMALEWCRANDVEPTINLISKIC